MQIKKPLPDSLMAAIRAVIADESVSQQGRTEATLLIALGYGLFSQADHIDPTLHAIPYEQSLEIASLLTEMGRQVSDLSAVNASLAWMNSGPSSYKAED